MQQLPFLNSKICLLNNKMSVFEGQELQNFRSPFGRSLPSPVPCAEGRSNILSYCVVRDKTKVLRNIQDASQVARATLCRRAPVSSAL